MTIKIRTIKENVPFLLNDENRPAFYNKLDHTSNHPGLTVEGYIKLSKNNFLNEYFNDPVSGEFNELNTLTATINISYDDLERYKKVNYVAIEVNSFIRFYFVVGVSVRSDKVMTLTLRLDTITTYLDKASYGGYTKVKRRHEDRFKIENNKLVINNSANSLLWNNDPTIDISNFKKTSIDTGAVIEAPYVNDGIGENTIDGKYLYALLKPNNHNEKLLRVTNGDNYSIPYFIVPIFKSDLGTAEVIDNPFDRTIYQQQTIKLTKFNTLTHLMKAATLESIIALDVPFINRTDALGAYNGSLHDIVFSQDGEWWGWGFDGITDAKLTYRPIVYVSSHGTTSDYQYDISLSKLIDIDINTLNVNDKSKVGLEPRLLAPQHMETSLVFSNGDKKQFDPLTFKTVEKFSFKQGMSGNGITTLLTFVNNEFREGPEKLIATFAQAQHPSLSSNYANFLNSSSSSYQAAKVNAEATLASNIVGSIATFGIMGGVKGAMSAVSSGVSGGVQYGNTIRSLNAQVEDIKRKPDLVKNDSANFIKDLEVKKMYAGLLNKPFTIEYKELTLNNKEQLHNHYNLMGYVADKFEKIEDYKSLITRHRFNFIQAIAFSNSIKNKNLPVEVLNDIDRQFFSGVRLWSDFKNINDYDKENWENSVVEHINV